MVNERTIKEDKVFQRNYVSFLRTFLKTGQVFPGKYSPTCFQRNRYKKCLLNSQPKNGFIMVSGYRYYLDIGAAFVGGGIEKNKLIDIGLRWHSLGYWKNLLDGYFRTLDGLVRLLIPVNQLENKSTCE